LARLLQEESTAVAQAQRLRRSVNDVTSRIAADEVRIHATEQRRDTARQRHGALGSQSEELEARIASLLEREAEAQPKVERAQIDKQTADATRAELDAQLRAATPRVAESE
jgi:chromosome segregation ATPase